MDTKTFNHTTQTRFPLDGMHAKVATTCVACHKQRSFLAAQPACATCHADPHKGSLGTSCVTCHSTKVAFKEAAKGFDHSKTRFALTGSHQQVMCAQCHVDGKFKGLAFDTCASCHQSPHRTAIGPTCTSCHTTTAWDTKNIVHDRTRFPLVGAHAKVACEKCHTSGDMAKPIAFGQCSTCHANVHGPSITGDCKTCHVETSFHVEGPTGPAATFDHAARTGFALDGRHATVTCRQCHANLSPSGTPLPQQHVDFRGAKTACVSCHTDPHKGENGATCQACHRTTTFDVKTRSEEHTSELQSH